MMSERHIIIIGGGLAGMAAGCYALRSGYRTTIVEHNLALGGVCTAWQRGPYTVDGCIHWLTGGAFEPLYRELGILPAVGLRTLDTWVVCRDLHDGAEVLFTRNLDALIARLGELAPEDRGELARVREGARAVLKVKPPIDAAEPISVRDTLRSLWDMRGAFETLVHFRKSTSTWANDHLKSPRLRRMFTELFPDAPAFFMLMVLAYLEQGYLSRPIGGTAAFRDALENSYNNLGGAVVLHATVDEVLVSNDRARGVRLADGTLLEGDLVISTASAPETVLRLLGGRYDAEQTRERMKNWKMFEPIVLASFGVERPYPGVPALMLVDHVAPFECGGKTSDRIMVRMCNDDASFAPPGHAVVQAVIGTDYDYWATRGTRYGAEKDALAQRLIETLAPQLPGLSSAIRMIDLATPLTFWNKTRSWRGAFEGWMPNADGMFSHVKKQLAGLSGFYMAGQWVEPGGGVPMAVMSGRQAVQLICADEERPFIAT